MSGARARGAAGAPGAGSPPGPRAPSQARGHDPSRAGRLSNSPRRPRTAPLGGVTVTVCGSHFRRRRRRSICTHGIPYCLGHAECRATRSTRHLGGRLPPAMGLPWGCRRQGPREGGRLDQGSWGLIAVRGVRAGAGGRRAGAREVAAGLGLPRSPRRPAGHRGCWELGSCVPCGRAGPPGRGGLSLCTHGQAARGRGLRGPSGPGQRLVAGGSVAAAPRGPLALPTAPCCRPPRSPCPAAAPHPARCPWWLQAPSLASAPWSCQPGRSCPEEPRVLAR